MPQRSFSPPLLTKTWFHPGPGGRRVRCTRRGGLHRRVLADDPPALAPPASRQLLLQSLPATRRGDALRSLRGQVLRTEVYALDGTDRQNRPYTVIERQYDIREENPPGSGDPRARVFFPHLVAERTTQWERGAEPMTQFTFTDDHDPYGQPRRQVTLAVPRGRDPKTAATAGEPYLGAVTTTRYAARDDTRLYAVDRVAATTSSEIVNDGAQAVADLYRTVQDGTATLAVSGQTCTYYDGAAFVGLPLGVLGDFAAAVRTERLVLTEEMLRAAHADPSAAGGVAIPPYLLPDGPAASPEHPPEFLRLLPGLAGHTFADGTDGRARGYYAPTSRVALDVQHSELPRRGLPVGTRDALGNDSTVGYDAFRLLPETVVDPVGLTVRADNDYRVLKPRQVTDENGNRRAVRFTPLGLVGSASVMGKPGEAVGDTEADPGVRYAYDLQAFAERGLPVSVRSTTREHHATDTDLPLPQRDATVTVVEYSDGFARLVQTRRQAEDVRFGDPVLGGAILPADQATPAGDTAGRARADGAPPNVVVSGLQVYDNKGQVVERYQPFFATGLDYQAASALGQKATTFYDPRGQVVRTAYPMVPRSASSAACPPT